MFIGTYVYDLILIGDTGEIKEFTHNIQRRFTVTIEDNLVKFVGCELDWKLYDNGVLLNKKVLIETLLTNFQNAIDTTRSPNTPS